MFRLFWNLRDSSKSLFAYLTRLHLSSWLSKLSGKLQAHTSTNKNLSFRDIGCWKSRDGQGVDPAFKYICRVMYIFMELSKCITTSEHGNVFRIIGPVWTDSKGHRRITLTKDQWCGALIWSVPESGVWNITTSQWFILQVLSHCDETVPGFRLWSYWLNSTVFIGSKSHQTRTLLMKITLNFLGIWKTVRMLSKDCM